MNQPNDSTSRIEPIDAMVVGSGFGGAVATLRLTEAGVSTMLLERGQRWPLANSHDTFSSLQEPDGRSAWLSEVSLLGEPKSIARRLGVLELVVGDGIASLMGAGYGGGSLVYAGALYQPSERLFKLAFGSSVDYQEMNERFYPQVRSEIRPTPVPLDILCRPEYSATRAWLELGKKAALPTTLLDLAVDWDVVRKELSGKLPPSISSNEFWYGNNSGAKLSLDRNYLAKAEATGRLRIATQTELVGIKEGPNNRYLVTVDVLDSEGNATSTTQYAVKSLFLAAGSHGTSEMLVRSKVRGWLPRLNDEVGNRWGNNGDFFSAISGLADDVLPYSGGTATVAIEDHSNSKTPTTVECFSDWTAAGARGSISSIGIAPVPALGKFSYDEEDDEVLLAWPSDDPQLKRVIEAGEATYERLAAKLGRKHPVSDCSFGAGLRRESLNQAWQRGHSRDRHRGQRRRSRHWNRACRPEELDTAPVTSAVTAHGLGGVVLDFATDNIGTLKNYERLYAIDGSLIAGHTGCTNPALTIAALAERNISKILRRDF